MSVSEIKHTVVQIADVTGFTTFSISFIYGVFAMFDIAKLNPAVLTGAVGGFIWILAKSYVHITESRSKIKREKIELEQLEADVIANNMKKLFNKETVTTDKQTYAECVRRWDQYQNDIEKIVSDSKRLSDLRRKNGVFGKK